jgi:hypothetical protein
VPVVIFVGSRPTTRSTTKWAILDDLTSVDFFCILRHAMNEINLYCLSL